MKDFFISYNKSDRQWAEWIAWILEEAGYTVVIQAWDFRAGENFILEMQNALLRTRKTILILSNEYMNAAYTQPEWVTAFARDPEGKARKLIPIRVRECEPTGLLAQILYTDLVGLSEQDARDAIHNSLRLRAKPANAPSFPDEMEMLPVSQSVKANPVLYPARENGGTGQAGQQRQPQTHRVLLTLSGNRTETSALPSAEQSYASTATALMRLEAAPYVWRREGLVNEILQLIRNGPLPIVHIYGLAGVGKTTLMREVCGVLINEFPHALLLPFDGPAAIEPAYVVDEINTFLISIGRGISPDRLQEYNQRRSLELLIAQVTDLRLLILLDAVDEVVTQDWLTLLLHCFQASSQSRVVVTTRERQLGSVESTAVSVPLLSESEALSFTAEYARAFELDIKPAEVLAALPASARTHPQALMTLLSHLRDIPFDLLMLEGLPEDARAPAKLIEQAVMLLTEQERSALALIEILSEIDIASALRVLRLPPPSGLVNSVQTLIARSLVNRSGGAYLVPAIVRESLWSASPAAEVEVTTQIMTALRGAISQLGKGSDDFKVIVSISVRMALHLREKGRWHSTCELADVSYLELLNIRGHWKEYSILLRLGIEAAEHLNNQLMKFRFNCRLARKLLQMGDATGARLMLTEVGNYSGAQKGTLDDAELRSHRALLYSLDGKDSEALEELKESRRIRHELSDREGLAVVELLIGNINLRAKEVKQARRAFESALSFLSDTPQSRQQVDVEANLALCDMMDDKLDSAESRLRHLIGRCHDLNYNAGLPRVLFYLALVLDRRGQWVDAAKCAQSAAAKFEHTDQRLARAADALAQRLQIMHEI